MNIIVIGSCQDSSTLAKELNRRLKNSIVARIDLLKDIKQLVLQGLNVKTYENLGTYVGDVETYDYTKIPGDKKAQVITAIDAINSNVKPLQSPYNYSTNNIGSTFDALTNGIPTSTYSFIKVYSGVTDNERVTRMLHEENFLANAVVITVKAPLNPLFPITISDDLITRLKAAAFAAVECESVNEVYKTEVFQMLFELTDEKELTPVEKQGKEAAVEEPGIAGLEMVLEEDWDMDRAA